MTTTTKTLEKSRFFPLRGILGLMAIILGSATVVRAETGHDVQVYYSNGDLRIESIWGAYNAEVRIEGKTNGVRIIGLNGTLIYRPDGESFTSVARHGYTDDIIVEMGYNTLEMVGVDLRNKADDLRITAGHLTMTDCWTGSGNNADMVINYSYGEITCCTASRDFILHGGTLEMIDCEAGRDLICTGSNWYSHHFELRDLIVGSMLAINGSDYADAILVDNALVYEILVLTHLGPDQLVIDNVRLESAPSTNGERVNLDGGGGSKKEVDMIEGENNSFELKDGYTTHHFEWVNGEKMWWAWWAW